MSPKQKESRKRASFEELLLTGISAVAAKGVDHTSVSDVALTSGVSRPTFYTYFGDMNGFYAEIWLRYGREWLNAQVDSEVVLDEEIDRVVLEIFAASRRIPEVFEVVQPEFEVWWSEQTLGNRAVQLRMLWALGFTLGYKLAKHITPKTALGLPVVGLLNLPENALTLDFTSGLGAINQEQLPPIAGLSIPDDSVESRLTLAAIDVISASGVAAASMTRIARRARVSTGTVYPRFKNAELLVRTSFEAAITNIVQRNVGLVASRGLALDEYALTVNAGFGENRKAWRNFRTEMHIESAHNPELSDFMVSGFEKAAEFLESSFREFGLPSKSATSIAWFLHSHAIGTSMIFNVMPKVADLDNRVMVRWLFSQLPK